MGNGVRFDVDEAQLHVVFGVVGSLCPLWGRFADVTRPTEEVWISACRVGRRREYCSPVYYSRLTFITSLMLLEKNCISNGEI
jgi:hypothetical protein